MKELSDEELAQIRYFHNNNAVHEVDATCHICVLLSTIDTLKEEVAETANALSESYGDVNNLRLAVDQVKAVVIDKLALLKEKDAEIESLSERLLEYRGARSEIIALKQQVEDTERKLKECVCQKQ